MSRNKSTKINELRNTFNRVLFDLICRIDDGYNTLEGNESVAEEYTDILLEEVSIRFHEGGK